MDQAKKLREMMEEHRDSKEDSNKATNLVKQGIKLGKVISISSGKGGVGKTNFAINLSLALKNKGYSVVILDADIGLGNVEILTGTNMKNSISDIIFNDKSIDEVLGEGPGGIKIISGGSGLKELDLIDKENLESLFEELRNLQKKYDYIIIDTGAGISAAVLDFIMATNDVIIIATPDPTSIMDAYVLIKSLNISNYRGKIHLVSNLVKNENQGNSIYQKINNTSSQFLEVDINYLGFILQDERVSKSVRTQTPFLMRYPKSGISKQVNEISEKLLHEHGKTEKLIEETFIDKFFNLFSK